MKFIPMYGMVKGFLAISMTPREFIVLSNFLMNVEWGKILIKTRLTFSI